ncbi:MAG: hypothetical protein HYW00_01030, partial [Candidatus Colwellbacteria bacterium]|nr:hypothetical protein [Candidatus Colwellbacteria bacterium]
AHAAEQPLGLAPQIADFYQWALGIGGIVALGVIIFGGILYTVSAGNSSRQEDAKQWITSALMGLLLLFGSFLILNTINPELTKLKDLNLVVNEAAQGTFTGSLGNPSANLVKGPDCGGFYVYGTVKAFYGNFADPNCEYANEATRAQYKDNLYKLLQELDPQNANHWFSVVIPHETSPAGNYNPNAVNRASTCVQERTCTGGACGLYQTDCECKNPPDCGGVDWQSQTRYAIEILKAGRINYWPCSWYTDPAASCPHY